MCTVKSGSQQKRGETLFFVRTLMNVKTNTKNKKIEMNIDFHNKSPHPKAP